MRVTSIAVGYVDLVFSVIILASLVKRIWGQVGASISEAVKHYAVVLKVSNPDIPLRRSHAEGG